LYANIFGERRGLLAHGPFLSRSARDVEILLRRRVVDQTVPSDEGALSPT
jgi:hypothetical protein